MAITASELRQNIYRLLDEVLSTGQPLEIERKGRTLRLVPDVAGSRLARIHTHPEAIVGDPEDLVSIDCSEAWDASRAMHP
jgi:antitoxin (DNA-binding transcriptional repressor) of toxin-antitoxin stability system